MLASLDSLEISVCDREELEKLMQQNNIANPGVLRDHRARGPIYYSLIFDAAKNAPQIFGLEPLKMINFKGIYVVDIKEYKKTLSAVSEKISSIESIKNFSKGKKNADFNLNKLTEKLKPLDPKKLDSKGLYQILKEFYGIRYSYTQYSFFFDTIVRAVEILLEELFEKAGLPASKKSFVFVPEKEPMEFQYYYHIKHFIEKYPEEIQRFIKTKEVPNPVEFNKDLTLLMDEFADLAFLNFSSQLQTKQDFLLSIIKGESYPKKMQITYKPSGSLEKSSLFYSVSAKSEELGFDKDFIGALFDFAGNLALWESEARKTWTRLHRAIRPLIEEVGMRLKEKGMLSNKNQVFEKEILEIIELSEQLK